AQVRRPGRNTDGVPGHGRYRAWASQGAERRGPVEHCRRSPRALRRDGQPTGAVRGARGPRPVKSALHIPEPTPLDFGEEGIEVAVLDVTGLVDAESAAAHFLTADEHAECARLQQPPPPLERLAAPVIPQI